MDAQVLIVGAGPVGLTLAIDLGQRGIRCILVERKEEPQFLPKMERCNARTMEIYRRMGLSQRIREAGFPRDVPMDVFIVTSLIEPPLLRLPYPSVAEAQTKIAESRDGSEPLEPYQLISQYTLEPLLKAVADRIPNVSVRYGCELIDFDQGERSVAAAMRLTDGSTVDVEALYLVGCDGGGSTIRKQLGIGLQGDANLLELRQALYRCDDLFSRIPIGKGRHYHVADERSTFLIVQDDTRHFTLHSVVENDADMAAMFEATVAMPVEYEMLYVGRWKQNLLLADRYREKRVFLAGDAVHLVIPTGGLGMNTGVGDAIDLSWKLAATIEGWGGSALLDSYEAERRQIGGANVAASRFASTGRRAWRGMWRSSIRDDTAEGLEARAALTEVARREQPKSNEMVGAELGYCYTQSPIVSNEVDDPPERDFIRYRPTTYPGARLPHMWLDDATPIQDLLGDGYTLLRLGSAEADVSGFQSAFAKIGAPLEVLDVPGDRTRDVYGRDLILLRPDMHVAWRGNAMPSNASEVAVLSTGHARPDRSALRGA